MQQYLDATEHKVNIGYEPKAGEDLEVIRAKRSEAKAFVDNNEEEVLTSNQNTFTSRYINKGVK